MPGSLVSCFAFHRASRLLTALGILLVSVILLASPLFAQSKPQRPQDQQKSPVESSNQVDPAAQVVQDLPPGPVHIVPFGNGTQAIKKAFAPAGAHLTYWGGPVISQVHVVAVFWGSGVNPAITGPSAIDQFFTDITQSQYFDLLSEYSTTGITGSGVPATSTNQTIQRGVFDGKFTIAPAQCATTAACILNDTQIQTELLRQLSLGTLPQPVTDPQGHTNTFYMIYFPPGVSISLGTVRSCVANGFCAYHSNTTSRLIPYGVQPDFAPPSGCATGCGAGTLFQQVTTVTSHELSEAVTDALVGSATTTAPPLAWYDPDPATNPLAEIGDICVGSEVIVSAGGNNYAVQQEFSNVQNDCVAAPPNFVLTAPTDAGPGLPFSVTLKVQSSNGAFNLTGYTGTVHFTSSDPTAVLPPDYTFTSADAGSHTFNVTLTTLGNQTITATDTRVAPFTGTATLNVNLTPDVTIAKTHTGNFNVGQTGAVYAISVSNVGHGPTTSAVTVIDSLPAGLTATAMGGTGWTCTLATLTCTRADALAVNTSYPPISLTVNVAANAPSPLINVASVSGGGEQNTANNTASDSTVILAPDMTVNSSHTGPIFNTFFQGETGATYQLSAGNNGNFPSSGTVTVVDTLPATGLTATAISGTGWSCTLATLTCTRSDSLPPITAYPVINLTVDVALNAPLNVTNTVSISGGGEVNTTDNLSQDLTIIEPPPAPDLSVQPFHNVPFVLGQSVAENIAVTNVGTAATSGTVTVVNTLPSGLTATAIGGTGWTCDLPSLTCTRSDSLAGFNTAYPLITISVNVTASAPTSVTDSASVSGGGDTTANNNTGLDPIPIVAPVVDLAPIAVFSPPSAFNMVQGQTGVQFTVQVQNFGNVSSNSPVSVVATIPVGLTLTGIQGPGWSCTASTATCSSTTTVAPFVLSPAITFQVDVAKDAPSFVNVPVAVSGGGDSVPGNNTSTITGQVAPLLFILNTIGGGPVVAGHPVVYGFAMTVNPRAGLTTYSCGSLPTGAKCTFSPPSLSSDGSVSLTITTTARAASLFGRYDLWRNTPWAWLISLLTMAVFAGSVFVFKKTRNLRPAFGAAFALGILIIIGCGGGGGGGGTTTTVMNNPNGTPAGTYTVVVTGTSPVTFASTNISLVVQ